MADINNFMVTGRVGGTNGIKQTKNGTSFLEFTVANTVYKAGKEETIWFAVQDWTNGQKYNNSKIAKGVKVAVVGTLDSIYSYIGKNGEPKCKLTINAKAIDFLSGSGNPQSSDTEPQQSQQVSFAAQQNQRPQDDYGLDDMEDDYLPF